MGRREARSCAGAATNQMLPSQDQTAIEYQRRLKLSSTHEQVVAIVVKKVRCTSWSAFHTETELGLTVGRADAAGMPAAQTRIAART